MKFVTYSVPVELSAGFEFPGDLVVQYEDRGMVHYVGEVEKDCMTPIWLITDGRKSAMIAFDGATYARVICPEDYAVLSYERVKRAVELAKQHGYNVVELHEEEGK